jgi:hypothetical protein
MLTASVTRGGKEISMSIETITRAIQFILAPVVMVSSCAILLTGILTVYNSLSDRLRAFTRERLELLRGKDGGFDLEAIRSDAFKMERLREIDEVLPGALRRHELAHQAALAMYLAIIIFVLSMFAIAVAVVTQLAAVATLAFILFLLSTAVMLMSVSLMGLEIRTSNMAIRCEALRVKALGEQHAVPPGW